MVLPGRLRATTLGDLLGTLYRARVTGMLELGDDGGGIHRVCVSQGLVTAVTVDGRGALRARLASLAEVLAVRGWAEPAMLRRSLQLASASQRLHGEILVEQFAVSPSVVDAALREQIRMRLRALEALPDATVRFRATLRPPRGALAHRPLQMPEFLVGLWRRRERERDASASASARPLPKQKHDAQCNFVDAAANRARSDSEGHSALSRALCTLGVPPDASERDVKRAFQRMVLELHPDRHADASGDTRARLTDHMRRVTEAYQVIRAQRIGRTST